MKLSSEQISTIRTLMQSEYDLKWELVQFIPYERRHQLDDEVAEEMKAEGKEIAGRKLGDKDFGVANLWGGEFARRSLDRMMWEVPVYLSELIETYKGHIHDALCVTFRYCQRRDDPEFSDRVTLATAVGVALFPAWTGIPIPITTISVYLVKYDVLLSPA
jgi:hypothetical protein